MNERILAFVLGLAVALPLACGSEPERTPTRKGTTAQVPLEVQQALDQLTAQVEDLQARLATAEGTSAEHATTLSDHATTLSDHDARLLALEDKTSRFQLVQAGGVDTYLFEGVNVQIRNGSGQTDCGSGGGAPVCDGTGNLILGYDELPAGTADRGGSHNLVMGPRNNYPGHGGLVVADGRSVGSRSVLVDGLDVDLGGNFLSLTAGVGATLQSGTALEITSLGAVDVNGAQIFLN